MKAFIMALCLFFACATPIRTADAAVDPGLEGWREVVEIHASGVDAAPDNLILVNADIRFKNGKTATIDKLVIAGADIKNLMNGVQKAGLIEIHGLKSADYSLGYQKYVDLEADFRNLLRFMEDYNFEQPEKALEWLGKLQNFSFGSSAGKDIAVKNGGIELTIASTSAEKGSALSIGPQEYLGVAINQDGMPLMSAGKITMGGLSIKDIANLMDLRGRLSNLSRENLVGAPGIRVNDLRVYDAIFPAFDLSFQQMSLSLDIDKTVGGFSLAFSDLNPGTRLLKEIGYENPPKNLAIDFSTRADLKMNGPELAVSQEFSLSEPSIMDMEGSIDGVLDAESSFNIGKIRFSVTDRGISENMGEPLKMFLVGHATRFYRELGQKLEDFLSGKGSKLTFRTNDNMKSENDKVFLIEVN